MSVMRRRSCLLEPSRRAARSPDVRTAAADRIAACHRDRAGQRDTDRHCACRWGAASGVGPDKLDLRIPTEFYTHPPPLTRAQKAMRDPRSNRLVLTKQEQMDVDFGVVECIAWQREPDGSIYRGPGHRQRIQGIGTNPSTTHEPGGEDRPMECVK